MQLPGADLVEQGIVDLRARDDVDAAHGRCNALVRRLVSYERAAAVAAR